MAVNAKMIETALGMLARFIPPEEYAKAVAALNELTAAARTIDARLARIEALVQRVDMLESIVRSNVDGASAAYAEQAGWTPEKIALALAPAQNGALNNDH